MARGYHQLGILAQDRGDLDEAQRRYRQSLQIDERLGDQAGMARSYHQLGILAQDRGDLDEAQRRYLQSLQINERLGNQAGMARSYHQLGIVAQDRGDLDEAERRYLQSLQIKERLGNQAGMATTYSQLGIHASERGMAVEEAIAWHLRALSIRLRLEIPQVGIDLSHLRRHRETLGVQRFTTILGNLVDAESVAAVSRLIDRFAED